MEPSSDSQPSSLSSTMRTPAVVAAVVGALIVTVIPLLISNNDSSDSSPTPAGVAPHPQPEAGGTATLAPKDPAVPTPVAAQMYSQTTLKFALDGCGRSDDLDLDAPEHPYLESRAEIDFESCLQGAIYAVGKNGALLSTAAPPDADASQCQQAVEEEPVGSGVELRAGQVLCVVHYDSVGARRTFRLVVKQDRAKSIVLTAVGWRG